MYIVTSDGEMVVNTENILTIFVNKKSICANTANIAKSTNIHGGVFNGDFIVTKTQIDDDDDDSIIILGQYSNKKRASDVFDSIIDALKGNEKVFELPEN